MSLRSDFDKLIDTYDARIEEHAKTRNRLSVQKIYWQKIAKKLQVENNRLSREIDHLKNKLAKEKLHAKKLADESTG